ncbi:MAG: hypothetical protein NWE89_11370 [Candidatus Bathyarchaeota archaeon]|nr:hypothetical protein [Candidatus Bathyarchaeota archaeon]
MSAEEKTLDELEAQASMLRTTRNTLFDQIKKLREERDSLNESSRKMREEALKHKEERDRINAKVKEIKQQLGPLFETLDEKKEKLTEAERALRDEYRNRSSKDRLERDLKRIEWEVMTTPTRQMLDREDELITRAAQLRKTLEEFSDLSKQEDQKMGILADKKATEMEIRAIREEMRKLSEQSQEHHEKMILFYEQVDKTRKTADETHGRYVEKIEEVNKVKEELNVVMPHVKAIRDGLKISDMKVAERRNMSSRRLMESMKQEALKKMENGKKLTFEDMRLIYGDEEDDEKVLDD